VKKFSAIAIALLIIGAFLPQSASAAARSIELIERPHQLLDGKFVDDELATLLSPEGRLGSLVYTPAVTQTRWFIDGALLDEVADMADGYELANGEDGVGVEIATAWLAQLRIATAGGIISPIAYGNPDLRLAKRLAPSELSFYQKYGVQRIAFHLGRTSPADKAVFKSPTFRARLAILLSPSINGPSAKVFAQSAIDGVVQQQNKLRVNPGKYALTSESGNVPLTLVNGFTTPVKINLIFRASNIRVIVNDIREITLDPQSRTQMAVPYTVITSGTTQVNAVLTNGDGKWLGPTSRLALSMTLIDSRVAWFTTAAAVLLFIGAGAQTYRRIRKGRK